MSTGGLIDISNPNLNLVLFVWCGFRLNDNSYINSMHYMN